MLVDLCSIAGVVAEGRGLLAPVSLAILVPKLASHFGQIATDLDN